MRRPLAALAGIALLLLAATACSDDRPPPDGATTIDVGGVEVAAIVRSPDRAPGPILTVLFLHGQSYTSRIWDDRGILDAVVADGHRAVAIDLPGYGDTSDRPDGVGADPISDGTWLQQLIEVLGVPGRTVIVSPSMSGRFSLAMLAEHPDVGLAGYVPIAPVGTDTLDRGPGAPPVPALIVYGEDDDAYTEERAARLVEQLGADPADVVVIPNGSHAAYDDEPEAFLDELLPFLAGLEGTG